MTKEMMIPIAQELHDAKARHMSLMMTNVYNMPIEKKVELDIDCRRAEMQLERAQRRYQNALRDYTALSPEQP